MRRGAIQKRDFLVRVFFWGGEHLQKCLKNDEFPRIFHFEFVNNLHWFKLFKKVAASSYKKNVYLQSEMFSIAKCISGRAVGEGLFRFL